VRQHQLQREGEQPAGVSEQGQAHWQQDDRHAKNDGNQGEQRGHHPEQGARKASEETHTLLVPNAIYAVPAAPATLGPITDDWQRD
jgi:hypothetical protein